LCAAAFTWYVTGRRLSATETASSEPLPDAEQNNQGILSVINSAGADAIRLALGAIPMLILSLSIVGLMQAAGVIEWLHHILMPVLNFMHIPD
ncbi:nucleoside recognition family protein, partial [Klebsiella pneumoniae]|nr:nucleoside recognition family protein [Klebsiella pneumoniae]